MSSSSNKHSVCVLGSGAWGTTAAKMIAESVSEQPDLFDPSVRMWVYEELVNGRKLSELINKDHVNPKYMPGIRLPANVIAVTDIATSVRGASILVFCFPHQFCRKICSDIKDHIQNNAVAVSLIKGADVEGGKFFLISEYVENELGISCDVLMGANIADEIAREQFSEATIGSHSPHVTGALLKRLFQRPYFNISVVNDVSAVELLGTLKNIVALGAGFVDGLGLGNNTKAAIMRIGLVEMRRFIQSLYPNSSPDIYFESCGIADLISTCYGGRNRKCAERFAKDKGRTSWDKIEKDLLNGQRLQGTLTAKEVFFLIEQRKSWEQFPLFTTIFCISFEGADVSSILQPMEFARRAAEQRRRLH